MQYVKLIYLFNLNKNTHKSIPILFLPNNILTLIKKIHIYTKSQNMHVHMHILPNNA